MRSGWKLALVSITLVSAAVAPALADLAHSTGPKNAPDVVGGYPTTHIVVKFRPGVDPTSPTASDAAGLATFNQKWGVQGVDRLMGGTFKDTALASQYGLDRWFVVRVPKGTDTPSMVRDYLTLSGSVELAELDGIGEVALTPNDTNFGLEWDHLNTGQVVQGSTGVVDADTDVTDAWDIWTGTNNRTIAIVDSGVDPHPEFSARLMTGFNTVLDNTNTSDGCPHGTHVTGTFGATGNNASGVAGMSWGVNILPVKVLTGCNGNETDCADGIIWAADHGANIITMSLQYYTGITYFKDAVAYAHNAGVLVIAATGNNVGPTVAFPAAFPFCMGVGATTNKDLIASFSNYGTECDLSAPGENVYSTWVGNSYTYLSGTSMATPHVSGLAALIWSFNPTLTNDQVEAILKNNVDDLGPAGYDTKFGWGRINAFKAIQAAGSPGVVTCAEIGGMRGRCSAGSLMAQVKITNSGHSGQTVTVDVDGVPMIANISGNKANLTVAGPTGSHTISLSTPSGCTSPVVVTCP